MKQERDLGPQPIADAMAEKGLKPADLVRASQEQMTHKMVSRAMKGRRLTQNTMEKVVRAYNLCCGEAATSRELFNYLPPTLKERRAGRAGQSDDLVLDG